MLTGADVPCAARVLPQPLLTVIPHQPAEHVSGLSRGCVKADGHDFHKDVAFVYFIFVT